VQSIRTQYLERLAVNKPIYINWTTATRAELGAIRYLVAHSIAVCTDACYETETATYQSRAGL